MENVVCTKERLLPRRASKRRSSLVMGLAGAATCRSDGASHLEKHGKFRVQFLEGSL